jgi:chorismate synthase
MPGNSFGHLFKISTFGESHGGAVGVVVDGVMPKVPLTEEDIQIQLDRRNHQLQLHVQNQIKSISSLEFLRDRRPALHCF